MKKKIIYLSIFVILLNIFIVSIMYVKKNNNIVKQDGIELALTLDGNPISTFPNYSEGSYTVNVVCDDGVKGYFFPVRESTTKEYKIVVEETNKNIKCNVDFMTKTNADLLKSKVETEGTSGKGSIVNEEDAGYRYEGQNPNNYVWFNNELWRIIGSIPVCLEENCGNSETNLVKIIRNSSIGGSVCGLACSNIHTLLNEYYYIPANPTVNTSKIKDATETEYCYGDDDTMRPKCNYTAIGIDNDKYYGQMIEKVYWNTGACDTGSQLSEMYEAEKVTQDVYNYVGLMTAADYYYAMSEGKYEIFDNWRNFRNGEKYTLGNWLFSQGWEWTSTLNFDSSNNTADAGMALQIRDDGPIWAEAVYFFSSVRPVLYLKDSVYVVSGTGTAVDPYRIAM